MTNTVPADVTFPSMGSTSRVLVGSGEAAEEARRFLEDYERRLSRFRPDSELSALNRDRRSAVPASALLRAAVHAAVWAAERTGGLVDPTLLPALRRAGYAASLADRPAASLALALAVAPPRSPAAPDPASRWREITIDDEAALIRRPPGLEIDNGGTGKGLAADAVAHRLRRHARFVVDCGGDIRVGGLNAGAQPYEIEVEHPLSGETVRTLLIGDGGVATSGLGRRLWEDATGSYAHHLLDPATGQPAWTGLVGATALAPTALEAESLAKAALLSGPGLGEAVLAPHGGLLFLEDGDVRAVGPLCPRPRLKVTLPRATANAA